MLKDAENKKKIIKSVDTSNDSKLMSVFRSYSKFLDDKNDKYERIYKTNRDVTQRSKKVIFFLQRIPGLNEEERLSLLSKATHDLQEIIQTLVKSIAMELQNEDQYQFLNAYNDGIEEYIEAFTFLCYLKNGRLESYASIQNNFTFNSSETTVSFNLVVPFMKYILGMLDLTGELMRFCIKSESIGDYEVCYNICRILQQIYAQSVSLGYIDSKELFNKVSTLESSLKKVEHVCYSLELRKSEIPEKCSIHRPSLLVYDIEQQ